MTKQTIAILISLSAGACTISAADDTTECTGGKCDGDGPSQTCDDPHYDNGTCDLQLSCGVPDIDCFRTFASDHEAGAWWLEAEKTLGESYPVIAESDPRFTRVRKALDAGWDAFKHHRSVGKLADIRPALVLVERPLTNAAFVFGDRMAGNQPFVVMVETASLESGATDDQILAVMMHELQHAVGLHKLGDVSEKLKRFYVAPEGTEPLGREQQDDADARTLGEAWIEAEMQVGPYAQTELGGFPVQGEFADMLGNVVGSAKQAHPAQCANAVQRLNQIQTALVARFDPLDQSLPADLSGLSDAVTAGMRALRDECLGASFPYGVIEVGAAMAMVTPEVFEAQLEPRDRALVKGKHFVDGLMAIVEDRRTTMRTAADLLAEGTGEDWSRLRYFSYEEDADDVAAFVMAAAGKPATSMGAFMRHLLSADAAAACDAIDLPEYGVALTDEHHATCWRIAHAHRLPMKARTLAIPPRAASVSLRRPGMIPTAPNPRDQIAN